MITTNIITLDPSIISTALVVNGKLFNYCRQESAVLKKKQQLSKWFELCKDHITYRYISIQKNNIYSDNEILNLIQYNIVVNQIITDIQDNLIPNLPIKIGMEGFSYASQSGPLIDLVTFSTLLRNQLLQHISNDIQIISPASLKLESCKLTYPAINIGKKKEKWEYRNSVGVAGGSFSKNDIFYSIVENDNFIDSYALFLKSIQPQIDRFSTIHKPLEDVNDAYILYQYLRSKL